MDKRATSEADVAAIKSVMQRELSLDWGPKKIPDWQRFESTFLSTAALFPAARPVKVQSLPQFIERMQQLQTGGQLSSFSVTPLGCEVLVFGNVAVAFAECELLENELHTTREFNATRLVHENDKWLIAAQAWDVERGNL